MKNIKKVITIGALVLLISSTSLIAYAASEYSSPAEIVADLTGKTQEEIIAERTNTNKTYGTIANEAGKLNEFKSEILKIKKDVLAEQVAAGIITEEKANEIIAALEENQLNCDGSGTSRIGQKLGLKFGGMNGTMKRGMNRGTNRGINYGINCNR